jgi:glucose uptake protein GlcU
MVDEQVKKSWWSRTFGRSLWSAAFGHFFADKNNAASVIAILLVATLCYIVAFRERYEYANGLLNIVFVVIGYYFGSKREAEPKDEDDSQIRN